MSESVETCEDRLTPFHISGQIQKALGKRTRVAREIHNLVRAHVAGEVIILFFLSFF